MRSVIPFCFKELVNFGFSMNHQWRIRYHSLFVSSLMEKENSRLAHIGTEKGGPFIPIRLTNLHKFIPLTIYLADHMLVKLSSKYLGKHISLRKLHHYPNYPKPEWKVAWLRWVVAEGLLKPEKMLSGEFYNPERLAELINLGLVGKQTFNEFLDRVVTIEMALRATGAELEKG